MCSHIHKDLGTATGGALPGQDLQDLRENKVFVLSVCANTAGLKATLL